MALAPTNTISVKYFGSWIRISNRYINHRLFAYKSYGGIFSAFDTVRNEKVLIRVVINPYESEKTITKALNDIKLMKYFDDENMIQLYDIEEYKQETNCALFFIIEFMDVELNKILASPHAISNNHVQYFIYCILRGLLYIHSAEVVVGNLSLEEIFVNLNDEIKIANYRDSFNSGKENLSENSVDDISTFLFLSPEYLLNKAYITTKSDIWSVGCMMAALLGKRLLFLSEHYYQQIANFIDVLGTPSEEDLFFVYDKDADFIRGTPEKPKKPWNELYPDADPLALEFLDKMLVFNPLKRWDAEKLIQHPYLADLHLSDDNIERKMPFEFDYHNKSIGKKRLKQHLKAEIRNFKGKI